MHSQCTHASASVSIRTEGDSKLTGVNVPAALTNLAARFVSADAQLSVHQQTVSPDWVKGGECNMQVLGGKNGSESILQNFLGEILSN